MGMFVGSIAGGALPGLWGADLFSLSTALFSTLGGLAGIWLGYKIGRMF